MGWENRNGREYYYQKRRIGGCVVSEYVGAGWLADAAATLDDISRQEREIERAAWREEEAQTQALLSDFNQVEDLARVITRASMLLSGYHPHKGQWRKKRVG